MLSLYQIIGTLIGGSVMFAKEAVSLTVEAREEGMHECYNDLQLIYGCIEAAANLGQTKINIPFIDPEDLEILKNIGYTIEAVSMCWEISWRNNERV